MKFLKKKSFLSLKQKKTLHGLVFISPFLIGFIFFFLYPFIQALIFSFSELEITHTGYELINVGLENYKHTLFVNPEFNRILFESVTKIMAHIPAVIIFSFFIANILNQDFKGRLLARLIFFLPFILSSGVIIELERQNIMNAELVEGAEFMMGLDSTLNTILVQLKLPTIFIDYIITIVDQIPQILEESAIPILIFLAGLQAIPGSLYESADIEGATGWEKFWKITWPLLSPFFLVNAVYVVVISLTSVRNPVVNFIQDQAWGAAGYGISVAMSMIYFIAVAVMLAIVMLIISKNIFYME